MEGEVLPRGGAGLGHDGMGTPGVERGLAKRVWSAAESEETEEECTEAADDPWPLHAVGWQGKGGHSPSTLNRLGPG